MFEYIVHVVRSHLRDYALEVTIPEQRARVYTYWNSNHVYVKGSIDTENVAEMETWYCDDLHAAQQLALHMASKCPGASVGVYKISHVARSPALAPVISAYTEKGLLPE
jgi:hypothetical protein